jgi:hypothetical protein
MSPTQTTTTVTPTSTVTGVDVFNSVVAVERAAPAIAELLGVSVLPGASKAQAVITAVQAGVAAVPIILTLIQQIVALLNSLGLFKHAPKAPVA